MTKKKQTKGKKLDTEYDLQLKLIDYLIANYPDVIFRSDLGGIRLSPGLFDKVKRLAVGNKSRKELKEIKSIAYPDFFIAEMRGGWAGCYIELKRQTSGYAKGKNPLNRELKNDDHVREQAEVLMRLREKGYYADFAGGLAEIIHLVDWYLNLVPYPRGKFYWPYSVFAEGINSL